MADSPVTTADFRDDPLNQYGYNILRGHKHELQKEYGIIPGEPGALGAQDTSVAPVLPHVPIAKDHPKVGIIGAGIGGLYAAMLLQERGIPYEILEASDRLGGRLYTKKMGERENDYFDVGAMRFPDTEVMKPVFDLIRRIKVETGEYQFKDKLGNSTLYYNNINKKRFAPNTPVTPSDFEITGIPAGPWAALGWEANVDNVVKPFADALIEDFKNSKDKTKAQAGWDQMMKYDVYSMRSYMAGRRSDTDPKLDVKRLMPYPLEVVNWCETFDKSSGWYDRGLSETVLESLAFSWDGSPIDWKYIKGGSAQLAIQLDKYMAKSKPESYTRPFFNTRVAGISCVNPKDMPKPFGGNVSQPVEAAKILTSERPKQSDPADVGCLAVHLEDGRTKYYSHVITTTTLPCLRTMNLSGARLDWKQKEALRMLQYGPSTKIGMRFRVRWWEDDEWMKKAGAYGAIKGGQSYTDNMSRTVVYPSFGIDQPLDGATMIVSYAWTNDALALTALMGPESRTMLTERVLQDLVEVHNFNPDAAAELEQMLEAVYPYSWTTDPNTMGAFAFFGPGDFKKLYPAVTRPAGAGRLHFAGEVCSVRHAWVLGALEASIRAVEEIQKVSYWHKDEEQKKSVEFEEKYGIPEGLTDTLLIWQIMLGVFCALGEYPPEPTSSNAAAAAA